MKNKKIKCDIYTRVSTTMQVDGYSLDAQKEKLKRYAEFQNMEIVHEYSDEGKSGKSVEGRPEFQRMLDNIENGTDEVQFVLVFKLSRFGRNAADVLNSLQRMQDFGVNLICVEDGIDSSKDSGKLMISVLSAVAEIERENILVQTMEGRKQKAREGKWNGGFAPYGYELVNGELQIAEDETEIIRLIYDKFIHTNMGISAIAAWLNLPSIDRIEAYDISNISGFQSVGSMIVYEKGKPKRADYRKFKIKSVEGPNDYASMKEVLSRRFLRGIQEDSGFERLPDLIMMDGGRGQVNIALEVLEEMDLAIPVCGMVKDDKHRTRGLYFRNVEIPIDRNSEGFKLITRVQDEAHRFAIEYHRLLRSKGQVHSILDDIPGIGPTRRKELMRHFQGIDDIKAATVEELSGLPGMNKKAAEQVYTFFHAPAQEENEDSSK